MKRMLFCFLLGIGTGAGGYWYFQQEAGKAQLEHARYQVVSNANLVATNIKEKISQISAEDIKNEMARTGMVVREKAKTASKAVADTASNARITTTIKSKLLADTGLNAFSINVDTIDGLVTLSGKVHSHDQVARAVKMAWETDGVHKVISTLQVSGS